MKFKKYQHIERLGTDEVRDIEVGVTYVFPKIDGTNASVWYEDGAICAGSRTRQLSLESDNAGFLNSIKGDQRILGYLSKHPTHRLFGEWLVPHTIKTYRDDAWRKFYIFDVCVDLDGDGMGYLSYDEYKPLLEEFNLDYISPLKVFINATPEDYIKCMDLNDYLIKDGEGTGEGIVVKNYDYKNKYGRKTWAKVVTSEFKDKHRKTLGAPTKENKLIEESIVDKLITDAFVEKEYSKIVLKNEGWSSKLIPQLLGVVYYEFIREEAWNIVKDFKNPTIDFKTLNREVVRRTKELRPELFS